MLMLMGHNQAETVLSAVAWFFGGFFSPNFFWKVLMHGIRVGIANIKVFPGMLSGASRLHIVHIHTTLTSFRRVRDGLIPEEALCVRDEACSYCVVL